MEIILANYSGFCFGVKKAVDTTDSELEVNPNKIYAYGSLIHNPQEISRLEDKGLITLDDFKNINSGRIIIRAHGIPKSEEDEMISKGLDVIDLTCPYVKSIHKRVEKYSLKGYTIIIIGDKNHFEVIGIKGYCVDNNTNTYIVDSISDVEKLPYLDKVCIVAQTTSTKEKFDILSQAIKEKANNIEVFNTICSATRYRQESAIKLSKTVDAMIVIGGYTSSNTNKLVEISKKYCKNVYHIESIKDLNLQEISKFNKIGITAGASTPEWIIKDIIKSIDDFNNTNKK